MGALDSDPWITGVVAPAIDHSPAARQELDGQEPLDDSFAEDMARNLDQIDNLP